MQLQIINFEQQAELITTLRRFLYMVGLFWLK